MSRKKRKRGNAKRRTRSGSSSTRPSSASTPEASTPEASASSARHDDAATPVADNTDAAANDAASAPVAAAPASAVGTQAATVHLPAVAPSPAGAVPQSMKIALFATAAAALVSTSVALFVVLRDDDPSPSSPVRTAEAITAADTADAEPRDTAPASVGARPTTDSVITEPPSAATPWPDLELDGLPPVGAAPETMGQSMGSPRDGALLAPGRLPNGRHYVIRDESTAWATSNTIERLRAAIKATRRKHPAVPRIVVGDISSQRGGPLPGHTSHQSGRDVDIGLIHRGQPKDAAPEFLEGTHENLDRRATYDLIAALAASQGEPGGVELIVLDYGLQRILRRSATARGIPEEQLEALFQFPHGPESRHGLVRHMPAHRDHLHVRFACPPDDRFCRSPLLGFAGMDSQ